MQLMRTSSESSRYSTSSSVGSTSPMPASSAAAYSSAPRTADSYSRFGVRSSDRTATVYAQVENLERPSKVPSRVTIRIRIP